MRIEDREETEVSEVPVRFVDLIACAEHQFEAAGIDTPRLDAEVLLAHAMGCERTGLLVRLRDEVPSRVRGDFAEAMRRRVGREPVAQITGEKEFYSLAFRVTRDVLIPRPETEQLVETVLEQAPAGARVLDVGTGSGCIAVALAAQKGDLELTACDLSSSALAVAADNARRHGVAARIRFVQADLLDAFESGELFDVIVSNPPYVAEGAPLAPELAWEPPGALFAGCDGMAVIDRLLPAALRRLAPGGRIVLEIGSDQAALVRASARKAGYTEITFLHDLAGHSRLVVASLRQAANADS